MWKWFKSAVDTVSADKFRIKVITLKDGTKKYYPQYKGEIASSYHCLIDKANKFIVLIDVSDYDLLHSNYYHYDYEDTAKDIIYAFKLQLIQERSKELFTEELIKVD